MLVSFPDENVRSRQLVNRSSLQSAVDGASSAPAATGIWDWTLGLVSSLAGYGGGGGEGEGDEEGKNEGPGVVEAYSIALGPPRRQQGGAGRSVRAVSLARCTAHPALFLFSGGAWLATEFFSF